MENMVKNIDFIKNKFFEKKIFVTGHTGFKGAWLLLLLKELNCSVRGYSLEPEKDIDLFNLINGNELCDSVISDIRNFENIKNSLVDFQPDYIFHLAAQPLVIKSFEEPVNTYDTNIMGTLNLFESLRYLNKKCSVVIITTDKVYENNNHNYSFSESDPLGGNDPYSSSKACVELLVKSMRHSFFNLNDWDSHQKSITVARAGNVIGGGDWSENRIIPDIARSIYSRNEINIRYPKSTRPWQHVLDPVLGYIYLAAKLDDNPLKFSTEFNFGPNSKQVMNVQSLVEFAIKLWGKGSYSIDKNLNYPESKLLMLNIEKARKLLGWSPIFDMRTSIKLTLDWYRIYENNKNESIENIQTTIKNILNDKG